jgi:hypothetical protein
MAAWVLLRHELPDGSWHQDWMLEDHRVPEGPLTTFRLSPDVDWPPSRGFAAVKLSPHRRTYLEYEGPVSGGRGAVRRMAAGVCEVGGGDEQLVVDLGARRVSGRAVGPRGPEQLWRFEVKVVDLEVEPD